MRGYLIFALAGCVTALVACGPPSPSEGDMVGVWKSASGQEVELTADGRAVLRGFKDGVYWSDGWKERERHGVWRLGQAPGRPMWISEDWFVAFDFETDGKRVWNHSLHYMAAPFDAPVLYDINDPDYYLYRQPGPIEKRERASAPQKDP